MILCERCNGVIDSQGCSYGGKQCRCILLKYKGMTIKCDILDIKFIKKMLEGEE